MSNAISIIRLYQRASRSPFTGDTSTILLLANLVRTDQNLALQFDRYIYLHRDAVGRWLGISLSNQLIDELNDRQGKYRRGIAMVETLYKLREEIAMFLVHFSDEFETVFGVDAEGWIEAAYLRWRMILLDAE
ncbi:hypothetical protein KJY73_21460 [Bowmanella sp. Y26]|uniref:hypothetical protein n=1 Tax=Bowmanella yangjiangensis TaxID=2811230 RepID=UPI001BDBBEB8|nr:hypothetical protein [Bowmanella yangjiangensis]MBT1066158.1 hypothetical protein [Bowmanella yangjiangensis]